MIKHIPFLAALLILFSCNRKGCADPSADNYDPKVVKVQNAECTYNGEEESPCGNQTEFCAEVNGSNLSGEMIVTNGTSNSIILNWTDSTSTSAKSIEIEIYAPKKGTFKADGTFQDGTFTVLFSDGQTTEYDVSGSLKITDYSTTDGLTATFNSDLTNGKILTKGYLFKVK